MGLGLRIEATILQQTNNVPRNIVFALTKRNGDIVLDDIVQPVVA